MNKYIEKIAESASMEDEGQARAVKRGLRAVGRGFGEALIGAGSGSAIGRTAGGAKGAALGSMLGGLAGGVHGVGRSVQNQIAEMNKQASTRLSREVDRLGLPGSGKDGGKQLGTAALNRAYTGASPTGQVLSGGTMQQPVRGLFSGRVKGYQTVPNTATRTSGDILARQPSVQDRLAAKRSGQFQAGPGPRVKPFIPGAKPLVGNVPKAAPPAGILQRALSLAKRHPVAAGIAGAGALGGLAYAAGNRVGQSQLQGMYYQ